MTIAIGRLNKLVKFQKATETVDAMGGSRLVWADYLSTYANIEWKEGKSSEDNLKITNSQNIEITIRNIGDALRIQPNIYRVQVNQLDPVVGVFMVFNITGIKLHGEINRYKTLYCTNETINNTIY